MSSNAGRQVPAVYGIALVAGGTVGAGMFSLPIISAGMWFGWSMLVLAVVWSFNYLANLLLLEANLLQKAGASFDTIVRSSLGPGWAAINNLGIAFVMFILLYAYFSAGGSLIVRSIEPRLEWFPPLPQNIAGLLFGGCLSLLVWSGTTLVSRISVILMIAMMITFLASNSGLILHVEISRLMDEQSLSLSRGGYLWAAIPFFVAAFACAGIVPSLVKYYGHAPHTIARCIRTGTLIALAIYALWLLVCFGTLGRIDYVSLIRSGGNMGDLVIALQSANSNYQTLIGLFSNFALTTSFLSIGLGLFDFIADRFNFADDRAGRAKTALCAFAPPALFSFFYPHGFVAAIGYAGLVVVFSFYVVPVLMAYRNRKNSAPMQYMVAGGSGLLLLMLLFSLIAAAAKLLGSVEMLPRFPA